MTEAILSCLLEKTLHAPHSVLVSDISAQRLQGLAQTYGIHTTQSNLDVLSQAQTVILAVKPQTLTALAQEIVPTQISCELVISILAGVSLKRLESIFEQHPVVRVMPNTPATVAAGISALAGGTYVKSTHLATAEKIFAAVGEVLTVPESWMDAVTALSGSGPAFVAIAVEALTDGGVAVGLPRPIAAQLALQTVRGTAELMTQRQLHPALMKDQVTSSGGTTIAGVSALEAAGFRSALIQAVQAACQRSRELGEGA
jgi:pyrroline-5-carboxylate reductase